MGNKGKRPSSSKNEPFVETHEDVHLGPSPILSTSKISASYDAVLAVPNSIQENKRKPNDYLESGSNRTQNLENYEYDEEGDYDDYDDLNDNEQDEFVIKFEFEPPAKQQKKDANNNSSTLTRRFHGCQSDLRYKNSVIRKCMIILPRTSIIF